MQNLVQFQLLSPQGLENSGAQSFPESNYGIKKQEQPNLRNNIRERRNRTVPRACDEIIMAIELYTKL